MDEEETDLKFNRPLEKLALLPASVGGKSIDLGQLVLVQ